MSLEAGQVQTGLPPTKKSKKMKSNMEEADRAQGYLLPAREQPGRIPLCKMGFAGKNRGGQGMLPPHVHSVAVDVCKNGTSKRRYNVVHLVQVPQKVLAAWRAENALKCRQNPLLAKFNDKEMVLATLNCTHFVGACKLIAEGSRTNLNQPGASVFKLLHNDFEGQMIQKEGVDALIYSEDLWWDTGAMVALMREDNANTDIAKPETEVDAFGTVHQLTKELSLSTKTAQITSDDVMQEIINVGLGNTALEDWQILVSFRILLPAPQAELLLLCLFHLSNGRVKSSIENFDKINALHPKKYSWSKVFLLIELYLFIVMNESSKPDSNGAMRQPSDTAPKVIVARTIDKLAIVELGKEINLLENVTKFFLSILTHYKIDIDDDEDVDQGAIIRANAGLMVACGRALAKTADALIKHKKSVKAVSKYMVIAPSACEPADPEKKRLIDEVMDDRLPRAEENYAKSLQKAKVFTAMRPKPQILHPRSDKSKLTIVDQSQSDRRTQGSVQVKLLGDGELDTTMTIADAVVVLGLTGNGSGGRVKVQDENILIARLFGTGIAFTSTKARVVSLNPPEATISVTGMKNGEEESHEINVPIEILLPCEAEQLERVEKDPLRIRATGDMQRTPTYQYPERLQKWIELQLEALLEQLACVTSFHLDQCLEVINIAGSAESANALPLVQCRAKTNIPRGALKLYPQGGLMLLVSAQNQREKAEVKLKSLHTVYMKAVAVNVYANRRTFEGSEVVSPFLLYTAFHEKGLVGNVSGTKTVRGYIPPYWAVMLTDRDNASMVNMHPYIDKYKFPNPIAEVSEITCHVKLKVVLPFLVNNRDLVPGELLVLPFDGGCPEIMSTPPPLHVI